MARPLVSEFGPLCVILWRERPAGADHIVFQARTPFVLIRFGLNRKRLRHESDLQVRMDSTCDVGVEDAIRAGPVVDWVTLGVFRVGVRAAPFERGCAIT